MNFELEEKLSKLLESKKVDEAIELAENELKKVPHGDFHQIIGKNLKHLVVDLRKYIENFDNQTTNILKKKQGFFKSLFSTKKNIRPVAFYCEMNGFTVNYDRWFIDLFAYEKYDLEDWDWLSDFYDSTGSDFTLTGFEEIQVAFQKAHEKNKLEDTIIKQAYDICELLVILRLQELFKEAYQESNNEWANIPMFVTAHDYEMIYQVN